MHPAIRRVAVLDQRPKGSVRQLRLCHLLPRIGPEQRRRGRQPGHRRPLGFIRRGEARKGRRHKILDRLFCLRFVYPRPLERRLIQS